MKQELQQLLRTAPVALVLALAAAPLLAQEAGVKATTPEQAQAVNTQQQTQQEVQPTGMDSARQPTTGATERQAMDPSSRPATPQVANESSDQNVPPATARKQAAEVAQGDPARWFREDATAAQRLRTVQKEIAAGLQEAQGNCKRMATAERASCLKEARAIYQKEMAGARARVMAESQR